MIKTTRMLKDKGWSIEEFLSFVGFSLRWYRTHCKKGSARHEFIVDKINELEDKQNV